MTSIKQLKQGQKNAVRQREVILELDTIVRDIERCEHTITDLQRELATVTAKYPAERTTRQDIAYLTDLLKCANRKLAWEKNIASLQKRVPLVLEQMAALLNDATSPPADQTRTEMLRSLQGVQIAMERLQNVKVS